MKNLASNLILLALVKSKLQAIFYARALQLPSCVFTLHHGVGMLWCEASFMQEIGWFTSALSGWRVWLCVSSVVGARGEEEVDQAND